MRVVVDTDVVVASFRSAHGASRQVMLAGLERRFTWLLTVSLAIEYQAVGTRADHLKASNATAAEIGLVLDTIMSVAERVKVVFLWRPSLTDADDHMVLEAAVNGRADMLVTFNRRHFVAAAERFSFVPASPAEALKRMERER